MFDPVSAVPWMNSEHQVKLGDKTSGKAKEGSKPSKLEVNKKKVATDEKQPRSEQQREACPVYKNMPPTTNKESRNQESQLQVVMEKVNATKVTFIDALVMVSKIIVEEFENKKGLWEDIIGERKKWTDKVKAEGDGDSHPTTLPRSSGRTVAIEQASRRTITSQDLQRMAGKINDQRVVLTTIGANTVQELSWNTMELFLSTK